MPAPATISSMPCITKDSDDILEITRRVEALSALLSSADGKNLLAGYKRAANILARRGEEGRHAPTTPTPTRAKSSRSTPRTTSSTPSSPSMPPPPHKVKANDYRGAIADAREAARAGRCLLRKGAGQRPGPDHPRQPPASAGGAAQHHAPRRGFLEDRRLDLSARRSLARRSVDLAGVGREHERRFTCASVREAALPVLVGQRPAQRRRRCVEADATWPGRRLARPASATDSRPPPAG